MANSSLCSIPDCGKPRTTRGLCHAHYQRWRKTGSTDGPIRISPNEAARYLNDTVLPYDADDCLIWPFARYSNGYAVIRHSGRNRIVSRLVCSEVHGEPLSPDHEAAHSCGNGKGGCVNPRHLSWKTRRENEDDKLEHGTRVHGEQQGQAKLTDAAVYEIRQMAPSTKQVELASRFGVSRAAIAKVIRRETWKHVP